LKMAEEDFIAAYLERDEEVGRYRVQGLRTCISWKNCSLVNDLL